MKMLTTPVDENRPHLRIGLGSAAPFSCQHSNLPPTITTPRHTTLPQNKSSFIYFTLMRMLAVGFVVCCSLASGNGLPVSYRLGKWGIETVFTNTNQIKEFILSDRIPLGWETSDVPWIFNDGAFSGTTESSLQKEMGKEVKKILETWGYIHE